MPELQPHVAFDTEKRVVHTIRCTDVLRVCESSDEFGSMAIVVEVEYTGDNAVPRMLFNNSVFRCFRVLRFIFVDDVRSRLW